MPRSRAHMGPEIMACVPDAFPETLYIEIPHLVLLFVEWDFVFEIRRSNTTGSRRCLRICLPICSVLVFVLLSRTHFSQGSCRKCTKAISSLFHCLSNPKIEIQLSVAAAKSWFAFYFNIRVTIDSGTDAGSSKKSTSQ